MGPNGPVVDPPLRVLDWNPERMMGPWYDPSYFFQAKLSLGEMSCQY